LRVRRRFAGEIHRSGGDRRRSRAEFARHELGAEFFAKLEADIAAFEQALASQRRGRETRIAATAAIDDAIDDRVRAVQRLDTIVRNKFAADPVALQAWSRASRTWPRSGAGHGPPPRRRGGPRRMIQPGSTGLLPLWLQPIGSDPLAKAESRQARWNRAGPSVRTFPGRETTGLEALREGA
jgi:hypothetical protein